MEMGGHTQASTAMHYQQPQQLQRRSGAPLLYSVKCTKDNVNYKFLVGAQNGKILRSSVEPAHSFLGK